MANTNKTVSLKGRNIYSYKNQTIYYDVISKKAYIVSEKNAMIFSFMNWRLSLCLLIIGFVSLFLKDMKLAMLLAVGAYVLSSLVVRLKYLKDQPINTSFAKPKSQGFFKDIALRYTPGAMFVACVLFASIALSLILNLVFRGASGKTKTIVIVLIVICLTACLLIIYLMNLGKKLRNNAKEN